MTRRRKEKEDEVEKPRLRKKRLEQTGGCWSRRCAADDDSPGLFFAGLQPGHLFLFQSVFVFSFMLIFLTKSYTVLNILYISFVIIVAIRITAYYTEELSRDVAKMLPFAILAIFLVDSSYFSFDSFSKSRFMLLPKYYNTFPKDSADILIKKCLFHVNIIPLAKDHQSP